MKTLFELPAEDISIKDVENFVNASILESRTHEFKEKWNGKCLNSIAAFGNTDGGILLIGVRETDGIPKFEIKGVPLETHLSAVQSCKDKLEPPFIPEMIPVETGSDQSYVLVIRVYPEDAPRPLVVDGTVYVRHPGVTSPASRSQIVSLVNEYATPMTGIPGNIHTGYFHEENDPDLTVQISIRFRKFQSAGRFLRPGDRRVALKVLQQSGINKWLERMGVAWSLYRDGPWRAVGHNTSTQFIAGSRISSKTEGRACSLQVVIEVGRSTIGTSVVSQFYLDLPKAGTQVGIDTSAVARLALDDLYHLVKEGIQTLVTSVATDSLPRLLTSSRLNFEGPSVEMRTTSNQGLGGCLDLPVKSPNVIQGCSLEARPDLLVVGQSDLDTQVGEWLEQMLLDLGISDADRHIRNLVM